MEGDFIHWKTGPSRYGESRLVNIHPLNPNREVAEGLAWIRDFLKETIPDGHGLPVGAMNFIDTAIKKGRENDNNMRRVGGLR